MRRGIPLLAAAALAALCLAGPCACRPHKPVARIAVAGPLTGDLGPEGLGMLHSLQLAWTDSAGFDDLPFTVEISTYDDRADPQRAAEVARQIAADPAVVAVLGHISSGCSIAAARIYAESGLAMLTPSATSPEVTLAQTRPDWNGPRVVFRIPASDAVLGGYTAQYAYDRFSLRRMAVINDGTAYGRDLADAFRQNFEAKGGQTLPARQVARGDRDFSALLQELQSQQPDGLFYGGIYTEFGLMLRQARAMGLKFPFMAGDGSKALELFDIAGPAADGAYLAVSGVPVEDIPSAADFVDQYRRRFESPPRVFDHYAYEAGLILLECVRKAGPDRAAMLNCIRVSRHSGMLGTIVFDAKGDTLKSVITMTKAQSRDKRFVPLY